MEAWLVGPRLVVGGAHGVVVDAHEVVVVDAHVEEVVVEGGHVVDVNQHSGRNPMVRNPGKMK